MKVFEPRPDASVPAARVASARANVLSAVARKSLSIPLISASSRRPLSRTIASKSFRMRVLLRDSRVTTYCATFFSMISSWPRRNLKMSTIESTIV